MTAGWFWGSVAACMSLAVGAAACPSGASLLQEQQEGKCKEYAAEHAPFALPVLGQEHLEGWARQHASHPSILSSAMEHTARVYALLSALFFYPVLVVWAVLLGAVWLLLAFGTVRKIRQQGMGASWRWLVAAGLLGMACLDLGGLLVGSYACNVLWLTWQKDVLLLVASLLLGFFLGKVYARYTYEEERLP